jgi:hypothetical protein
VIVPKAAQSTARLLPTPEGGGPYEDPTLPAALVSAVVLTLGLAACGSDNPGTPVVDAQVKGDYAYQAAAFDLDGEQFLLFTQRTADPNVG